jgi:signal transduction histidine kinase/tetratricopeptide (TPR) repeat protein
VHLYRGNREQALEHCMAALAASRPAGVKLRALSCRAALHLAAGEFASAAEVYGQGLDLARRLGDRVGESSALNNLGVARSLGGDAPAAIRCWEESLTLRRSLRYFRGVAECLNNLGIAHYGAGRPAAALAHYHEALAIDRQIGDRRGEGLARLNLGEATFDLSLYRTALEHTRESLVVARAIGDRDLTLRGLLQLGGVLARTGELEELERTASGLKTMEPGTDALGRGAVARLAGLAAGLRGRIQEALDQLQVAREALAEAGEARLAAESALDAAELVAGAGTPRQNRPESGALAAGALGAGSLIHAARQALEWLDSSPATAPVRRTPVLHSRRILLEAGLNAGEPASAAASDAWTTSMVEAIAAAEQAECRELAGRGRQLLGETLATTDPGRAAGEFHRAIVHLEQVVADGSTVPLERRLRIEEARAGLERARAALSGARHAAPAGASAAGALVPAAGALVAAATRAELATCVLAAVRRCVAAERGLVAQVAPRSGRFELLAQEGGFSPEELEAIQIAARRHRPDLGPEQRLLGQAAEPEPGFSSLLAGGRSAIFWLPIPAPGIADPASSAGPAESDSPVRFVYADSAAPAPLLGETDLNALRSFAEVTAAALLALEERTALATKLQHITRLYELSSSSVHTLDVNEVIDRSMEAMIQLTQAERGFLFLIEEEGIQVKVARGARGEVIDEPTLEVSWSIVREVVAKKQAMRVDDALSDRLLSSSVSVFDLNLRSVMCVPIRSGDRLIGVAYVDHRRKTALFDDGHLRVFELFGHQIAAALENAITHSQVNEANRLKAEFLNNISHELRTPLTSIMGFTDCLSQQPLPPDAEIQVELIQRSSEVLRKLVERVLTFSALESNVLPVVKQPFSLPGLLTRLRVRFEGAAESKRLDFMFETARTVPPFLSGDPDHLAEVLENLIENAIKFTREGTVALKISRESRTAPGVVLGFEVVDTGIGIPIEDQERIFDPFVQGDGSSTRPYGGMGLGLTTSARLVKRLGGELEIESSPGRGTAIRFRLPFDVATAAPPQS